MEGIVLDFAAKSEDEVVHDTKLGQMGVSPDQRAQLSTCDDAASPHGKRS